MADDELLAHRLMCLASALPRSLWAPGCGLSRFAAAPGLLELVVTGLILVALQAELADKITSMINAEICCAHQLTSAPCQSPLENFRL